MRPKGPLVGELADGFDAFEHALKEVADFGIDGGGFEARTEEPTKEASGYEKAQENRSPWNAGTGVGIRFGLCKIDEGGELFRRAEESEPKQTRHHEEVDGAFDENGANQDVDRRLVRAVQCGGTGHFTGTWNGHVHKVANAGRMDGAPHGSGVAQVTQHIGPTLAAA